MSVAPSLRASSSFQGWLSIATIRDAPAIRQPWSADRPTPPHAITAQVLPGSIRAVLSTAPTPVVTPQPISAARSSGMSLRIFTSERSWVSICSANEDRFANWSTTSPFFDRRGLDPAARCRLAPPHRCGLPRRHISHVPHHAEMQPIT